MTEKKGTILGKIGTLISKKGKKSLQAWEWWLNKEQKEPEAFFTFLVLGKLLVRIGTKIRLKGTNNPN